MITLRAIVFDLDGTLVDAYPGIHESLNEMLAELHLPAVDLSTVKRRVGRGVLNLIQSSVPGDKVQAGLELFRSSYDRTHLSGTHVLPDVSETLEQLKHRKIRLAVASNKPAEFTKNILEHFDLEKYFDLVAGPNLSIRAKPDPSMMNHVLATLNVRHEDALYVGDMTLDAETAQNAGMKLALIPTGGHTREELEACGPDYLLNRISDLIRIVDAEV